MLAALNRRWNTCRKLVRQCMCLPYDGTTNICRHNKHVYICAQTTVQNSITQEETPKFPTKVTNVPLYYCKNALESPKSVAVFLVEGPFRRSRRPVTCHTFSYVTATFTRHVSSVQINKSSPFTFPHTHTHFHQYTTFTYL